jgi:sugar lactone lactonase YvrE
VISGNDRLLVGAFSFDDFAIGELDVSERFEYARIFQLGRQIGRPSSVDADGQFSVRKGFYPPRMVLSVAPSGRLYVADAGRLQWFRSDGLFLGSRRDLGIWSVAAATDGTLWTTSGSGIRHLDAEGARLATFLAPGPGSADDIVVAPDGTLFVADTRIGLVQHLSSGGRKLGAWGSPLDFGESGFGICFDWDALGASCGQQLIALSPDGTVVYLLASSRGRVHRYTVEGEWLGGIDGLTAEPEIQQTAQGIAVAPDGSILVADTAAREVIRFAPDGSILERIVGAEGKARGQFDRPGGLAVAPDGAWFVADREHGRVLAYGPRPRDSWRGEYFGNPWLVEHPLAIAESADIDFEWTMAAPDPALEAEAWSARFERTLRLSPGAHSFELEAEGGARLWLGDSLVVDDWGLDKISRSGAFEMPLDGEILARLEFRDATGPTSLSLTFDGARLPTETREPTATATATLASTETPIPTATPTRQPLYLPMTWRNG